MPLSRPRPIADAIASPLAAAATLANPKVLVIAHRGVFDRAPENSLAALERAVALGVDMMELDAQATDEGLLLTLHDDTLDRTTTAVGPAAALTEAALGGLRLRAGQGGPGAEATEERLPRLAEMLEAARGRILLNIDTKHARDLPAVGRLVLDLGMADEVVVKAEIDPFAARQPVEDMDFFGRVPFMPVLRLTAGQAAAQVQAVARLAPPMIECKFDGLDALRETRAARSAADSRLWVNSLDCAHCLDFNDTRALLDPEGVWGELLEAGVGAIQTDIAETLIAWLGARHGGAAR
ncbi:glycerophosphoryl diester phosphodiesterase [Aureimonas endophytica]|uniref:Glycerophosphoryl diester phosphodiesterase n=1 Tax=Aureimonas endophytica TaxID=2027858 RepID=A0A917E8X4_9HYPH|nr:glycerophosphodiester phosphodiesterase family protein [Aureimonas endophytica]GGE12284.1 glycerophosphoryl diester phosphodiesterase [Aureimonas endophytica]